MLTQAILSPFLISATNYTKRLYKLKANSAKLNKVTTELVLIEVLNYFCEFRLDIKDYVIKSTNHFVVTKKIEIIPCSSEQFIEGFYFYKSRLDKGYSLTDCVSMNVMRERNINEILTNDDHFEQEGFRILL